MPEGTDTRSAADSATHDDTNTPVEVTQADRDAAAGLVVPHGRWPGFPTDFRSGRADTNSLTQAFAKHRTDSLTAFRNQQDRSRTADDTFSANNSELEPDGKDERSCQADRQGGAGGEVGGRAAVLSGGVQCGERNVRGEDSSNGLSEGGADETSRASVRDPDSLTSLQSRVERLAYGYELMHRAICHMAGTSGANGRWYMQKAQETQERVAPVFDVTADSNAHKPGDCLTGYKTFLASTRTALGREA